MKEKTLKVLKIICCSVFVAAEFTLWLLVVTLSDVDTVNTLCYVSVLLAFFFSLLWLKNGKSSALISIALFFTACADYCLVVNLSAPYELALAFFAVVQLSYCVLLAVNQSPRLRKIHLFTRGVAVIAALLLTVVVLGKKTDLLSLLTIFYFSNLVCNFAFSCVQIKSYAVFALGLLFFIGCDVFVGLRYADGVYFNLPTDGLLFKLTQIGFTLIWTCYIPSQTLISLASALVFKRKGSRIKTTKTD